MDYEVKITDNSAEILKEMEHKTAAALEAIGLTAETYAKLAAPVGETGRLRNSISHTVKGDAVYIGSNLHYFPWHEWGTGIFAEDGSGRKSPWAFQDSKGKWHNTRGVKPKHMLKNAALNHNEEYRQIIENIMKKD